MAKAPIKNPINFSPRSTPDLDPELHKFNHTCRILLGLWHFCMHGKWPRASSYLRLDLMKGVSLEANTCNEVTLKCSSSDPPAEMLNIAYVCIIITF